MITICAPFLFSFLTGYFLLLNIFEKKEQPCLPLSLFLSAGIGLGVSSVITFLGFLLLNSFHPAFVIAGHVFVLFVLILKALPFKRIDWTSFLRLELNDLLPFLLLGLAMITVWIEAKYYPLGGWDAWSVWNYKAKFLFLAGEKWQGVFAPFLWRSSPHYPLLLPLINVWGWTFMNTPTSLTPLLTSVLFTFLTAGLLYAGLYDLTKNHFTVLAPLLMLSSSFYTILATSQYCDIVLSFYLLSSLFCLIKTLQGQNDGYAILTGIFLGLLSFTKPEGSVASLVISCLTFIFILLDRRFYGTRRKILVRFIISLSFAALATIIFQLFLSPGNQTYINGLSSAEKPSTLYRLKFILVYLGMDLQSEKWNGLWLLLAAGALLNLRHIFRREIAAVWIFLGIYLGIILSYYYLNTYFKIEWWLQVTLDRILFSLLPIVLLGVFYGLKKVPSADIGS